MRNNILCSFLAVIILLLSCGSLMAESTSDHEVIIIGAGVSGLTAAYFLKDYDIKIIEKEDRVGGRTFTGTHRAFHYAKGTEYLGEPYDAMALMIDELNLKPVEIPSPMDAHLHDGELWYGYDGIIRQMIGSSDIETFNNFASRIIEINEDYEDLPAFDEEGALSELDYITASDWFDEEGFPEAFKDIYNVSSKGLFGANMDEISALSFISEIAFDYEDFARIEDLEDLDDNTAEASKGGSSDSYTFVTGITELTDAIAGELGDRIELGARVTSVAWDEDEENYNVYFVNKNGRREELSADIVISAVPAPVALQIAGRVLSAEQKQIMRQVHFADFATVCLFSDEVIWDSSFDLAVPDGWFFTDIYDSTWVERYYSDELRDRKEYIAGVYVSEQSYKDTTLQTLTDAEILEKVYIDLEKIFPGVRGKVDGCDVYRHVFAYPVMTLGAYHRLSRLHEIAEGSFLLAGDFMVYPTFEAAVDSGFLAAEKAMEEF